MWLIYQLANGKSVSELAKEHEISIHTLQSEMKAARKLLGQRSAAGVVAYCLRHGLIE
mgnify:CR=1 FL=1